MAAIRITKVPPGNTAPPHIRAQWVGVCIPLSAQGDEKTHKGRWSSEANAGGYVVTGRDAVEALRTAGKNEAADYWSNPVPPTNLRFALDCCELIG